MGTGTTNPPKVVALERTERFHEKLAQYAHQLEGLQLDAEVRSVWEAFEALKRALDAKPADLKKTRTRGKKPKEANGTNGEVVVQQVVRDIEVGGVYGTHAIPTMDGSPCPTVVAQALPDGRYRCMYDDGTPNGGTIDLEARRLGARLG